MYFQPAAGVRIEDGVTIINDALAHDTGQPLSPINEPKLYIAKSCENLIYSLREWTGADGDKGASKDPIDCLRYLGVMQPEQYEKDSFKSKGGGSY
jgi:hypothetical protein